MQFMKKTVRDVEVAGKTVLVRVDWNVPGDSEGAVGDDYRIIQSLPTLKYLVERDAKVVVISHRGRPKGEVVEKYSLRRAAEHASELLGVEVDFVDEIIGERATGRIGRLESGQILCLENLRFDVREKQNDSEFAVELANGCDLFVQDGFGVVHRAHTSTAAVTDQLPSVSGLLLEREIVTISESMQNPERPLVSIIGGAKISDKIEVIEQFMTVSDSVMIGGAMANTFLVAQGHEVGASLFEEDAVDTAKKLLDSDLGAKIILLTDGGVGAGKSVDADAERTNKQVDEITDDDMALDVVLSEDVRVLLEKAVTVIWNGPVGYTEIPVFAQGSNEIAELVADKPTTIIGGGDTAGYVRTWQQTNKGEFSHISTGGGASLDLMAGKELPGVAVLLDK
jgi:phosphoglycerate kinase